MTKQCVVITGSSRGIGLAAAERFAKEGNRSIIMNCKASGDVLAIEAQKIREKYKVDIIESIGDVSDADYVSSLFQEIQEKGLTLDVLVNNAGIDYFGLLQDMSEEDWDRIMNVNLKSVFLCMKHAIPLMLNRDRSSLQSNPPADPQTNSQIHLHTNNAPAIVNVSSVWGTIGGSCEAAYSASKGGINALTRAMASELAPSGIRVNALAFGAIDTAMNGRLTSEEKEDLAAEIPLGRMGTVEEAAEMIYQCAVNHTYLTGQVITMDGGWT